MKHTPKIILTKGLPASGKTTWAKEQVDSNPGKIKRVNKDDLRAMINNSKWSKQNESDVLANRDMLIVYYLNRGFDVIVDDTNLAPKHESHLRQFAEWHKADFEIKDFTDVSVEECIKRDQKRPNYVGEKVIRGMYKQFLAPKPELYDPGDLPSAVLCDIDGTLAHMDGKRSPFEWAKVGEDRLDETVANLISVLSEKYPVILLSGRDSVCRDETIQWLTKHNIQYHALYMRPEGDMRKDNVVKRELFDNHIRDRYAVEFVLDDRNQVVDMWRSMGLKCYQVAEGDF